MQAGPAVNFALSIDYLEFAPMAIAGEGKGRAGVTLAARREQAMAVLGREVPP